MTVLIDEIRALIAAEGPIGLDRYMALCLAHPVHGYYRTRDPFGAKGDFITAPDISQMFGELLGLWAVETWQRMGQPDPFLLVELGPGRGTLMKDALRAARLAPEFLKALRLHLVETSPVLRAMQEQALQGFSPLWHESIETLPHGPAIVLSNEFFDALPIRQFVRQSTGWHERLIGCDAAGILHFGLSPFPDPSLREEAPTGSFLEMAPARDALMQELSSRLVHEGGAVLVIDYGHTHRGFGDTFQAMRAHGYADPLHNPGSSDLTSHVDFWSLMKAAEQAGGLCHGPETQGAFLDRLGIAQRAQSLIRHHPDLQESIESALHRLTKDMGSLFKVLGVSHPEIQQLAGF